MISANSIPQACGGPEGGRVSALPAILRDDAKSSRSSSSTAYCREGPDPVILHSSLKTH